MILLRNENEYLGCVDGGPCFRENAFNQFQEHYLKV